MPAKTPNDQVNGATRNQYQLPRDLGSPNLLTGLHGFNGHTRAGVAWSVHRGDVRRVLASFCENRFACVVTSPPYYWQRDYSVEGQIGMEQKIEGYVSAIVESMDQVRRVLRNDGVLFLNLGDTYYSAKGQPKGTDRK